MILSTSGDLYAVYYHCKTQGSFDEAAVKAAVVQLFKDMNYVGELSPEQLKQLAEWVSAEADKRKDK